MAFILHKGAQEYFTCPQMDEKGIRHFFTTRIGGVSDGPFSSWNFAEGASDTPDTRENVLANDEIAASLFGLHKEDIVRTYQTHSASVLTVDKTNRGIGITSDHRQYLFDGAVTKEKGVILSVRTADCVPILLSDPEAGVIGAVHSGWRGTAAGISLVAVDKMVSLGARREHIIAAIGPCAGVECYRVGDELSDHFTPDNFKKYPDGHHLDLTYANTRVLLSAGIADKNIHASSLCTVCDPEHFFSHRRDGARRGVMAAFITL